MLPRRLRPPAAPSCSPAGHQPRPAAPPLPPAPAGAPAAPQSRPCRGKERSRKVERGGKDEDDA
uniref:Uncharacterized protein n=1 Tax=Oryza rufipogon TaxID=4529 RepID=A0A0E0QYY5_ORYRU